MGLLNKSLAKGVWPTPRRSKGVSSVESDADSLRGKARVTWRHVLCLGRSELYCSHGHTHNANFGV